MAREAAVFDKIYWSPETTPGTPTTSWKQPALLQGHASPRFASRSHRGSGSRDIVAMTQGKERSEWGFEGEASFPDLLHPLAAHFKTPGIASSVFTYAPASITASTLKTMSLFAGSVANGRKAAYGFCSELRLRSTLEECSFSGTFIGQALTKGQTLPVSPSVLPVAPFNPATWIVKIGAAMDGSDLATVTTVLEHEFSSGGRNKPQNFADGTLTYADVTPMASGIRSQVVMEDNAAAAAYLTNLRAGTKGLVRYIATGPLITGSTYYTCQITHPFFIQEESDANNDDLDGLTINLPACYDAAFLTTGGVIEVVLTTAETAL